MVKKKIKKLERYNAVRFYELILMSKRSMVCFFFFFPLIFFLLKKLHTLEN